MPKVKNATSERSGAVMDAFGIVSQRRASVPKDKFLLSKYFDDKNFQHEYPSPYVGMGLDRPDRTSEIYGAGKPHPKTGCRKIISGKQHIDESSDDFDTLKKIFLSSYIQ